MEQKISSRVPISEQDKLKSYYKYYDFEMTPAEKEKYNIVLNGPIDSAMALRFQDRNDLFDAGYLDAEIGYCIMEDGTGFLANLTTMPRVTTEMFDWWFAWHGLDNLRYKIWNPEEHYKAETQNRDRAKDKSLTYKERYWNTTHNVIEDIGMGPENMCIDFKTPGDLGFDISKIGTEACSTIVCAQEYGKEKTAFALPPTIMTHFLREIDGGVELRSRFWMGWTVVDGKDVKVLPDKNKISEIVAMMLLLHNIKEYTHLAEILPEIYAEEKDNF